MDQGACSGEEEVAKLAVAVREAAVKAPAVRVGGEKVVAMQVAVVRERAAKALVARVTEARAAAATGGRWTSACSRACWAYSGRAAECCTMNAERK